MNQRLLKLRHAGVAAVLLVAGHAFAGTYLAELGFGSGAGKDIRSSADDSMTHTPTLNAAFGYRWDSGFGVRALTIRNFNIVRGIFSQASDYRTFDYFNGVEATGYAPIASSFKVMGGLGIGQTKLDAGNGADGGTNAGVIGVGRQTEGVVSLGLQWQPVAHYAMELHVDYLTKTATSNIALMAQVPF